MKTATIYEISKILNISTSTVSRALRNHRDIAPQTKEKVLELARQLNYEPNLLAVGLRQTQSRELAIIAPFLSGFFYESFISSVESEAKGLGYSVIILLSGDDPEVEMQNLKMCKQRKVACVMLCVTSRTTDYSVFNSLKNSGVPIIFFDKVPELTDFVSVSSDDHEAAIIAARALLNKGRKNILAIFGDLNFSITRHRLDSWNQVMTECSRDLNSEILHAATSKDAEQFVINRFKGSAWPDAIFCMSDEILIGVMKAIQVLKLSVPDQVSVIAISNGFFPTLYYPEITYVETSGYKLGQLAMNRFLGIVNESQQQSLSLLPPVYVEGGSL